MRFSFSRVVWPGTEWGVGRVLQAELARDRGGQMVMRGELCDSLVFRLCFFFPTRLAFDSASLRLHWLSTSTSTSTSTMLASDFNSAFDFHSASDFDTAFDFDSAFDSATLRLCSCTNKDSASVIDLFAIAAAVVNMSNHKQTNEMPCSTNLLSQKKKYDFAECFVKNGEMPKYVPRNARPLRTLATFRSMRQKKKTTYKPPSLN